MKSTFILITLVTLSVSLLTGAAFATYFLLNSDRVDNIHDINLTVNGQERVEFKDLMMIPGESVEYDINLTSEMNAEAYVTLQFIRDESAVGGLEKYAYARIELEGEVLRDALIGELMEKEPIMFRCKLETENIHKLKVTYYMPESVGNEAQNAEASFELLIVATNEWSE